MKFESNGRGTIAAFGHRSVLALALTASQSLRALVGLKLAPLGLALGQDRFLLALDERGSLSVSALADVLGVRPSTVSKMMDRLADRGYAYLTSDKSDARRTTIGLSDDGRALCEELRLLSDAIEADIMKTMEVDDRQRMIDGIGLLNEAIQQRLHRLR